MDKYQERAMGSSLSMNRKTGMPEMLEPMGGLLFGGELDH